MNPAIDVGQIEGALVMTLGHMLLEKEVYDPKSGRLLTNTTWVWLRILSQVSLTRVEEVHYCYLQVPYILLYANFRITNRQHAWTYPRK